MRTTKQRSPEYRCRRRQCYRLSSLLMSIHAPLPSNRVLGFIRENLWRWPVADRFTSSSTRMWSRENRTEERSRTGHAAFIEEIVRRFRAARHDRTHIPPVPTVFALGLSLHCPLWCHQSKYANFFAEPTRHAKSTRQHGHLLVLYNDSQNCPNCGRSAADTQNFHPFRIEMTKKRQLLPLQDVTRSWNRVAVCEMHCQDPTPRMCRC